MPARVKLDISAERDGRATAGTATIAHPYPDAFPLGGPVRSYSFEEVFAEKIRAMAQRGRPRDLYDIVNLFRRNDLRMYPDAILSALEEKCVAKGIARPDRGGLRRLAAPRRAGVGVGATCSRTNCRHCRRSDRFLDEVPVLFALARRRGRGGTLPPHRIRRRRGRVWSPPPSVATWGVGVPLETVRFAAANHLLVDLDYDGRHA